MARLAMTGLDQLGCLYSLQIYRNGFCLEKRLHAIPAVFTPPFRLFEPAKRQRWIERHAAIDVDRARANPAGKFMRNADALCPNIGSEPRVGVVRLSRNGVDNVIIDWRCAMTSPTISSRISFISLFVRKMTVGCTKYPSTQAPADIPPVGSREEARGTPLEMIQGWEAAQDRASLIVALLESVSNRYSIGERLAGCS
jgi:hypothetical protein